MLFLDLIDLLAESRLGNVQSVGGPSEIQLFGQDKDCLQEAYIDPGEHSPNLLRRAAGIGYCPTSSKGTSEREKAAKRSRDERRKEICTVRKYFDAFLPQPVPELV
jgi:hypothetical protein